MATSSAHFVSYKVLAEALFEAYENIYDIELINSNYRSYHQSEQYRQLRLSSEGENFFTALSKAIPQTIYPDDRYYVENMLERNALQKATRNNRTYSFIYRILDENGNGVYHQLRAVKRVVHGKSHILIGIKNIDGLIRLEEAHKEEISALYQKERNYLQAILANSAAYIEANLTTDLVTEKQVNRANIFDRNAIALFDKNASGYLFFDGHYSTFQKALCDHVICENADKYREISDKDYLLDCFSSGTGRASVLFSIKTPIGTQYPCHEVFYLYKETVTGDVHVLCVIYDLTEKQRHEREIAALKNELMLSRIRNSTSQIQPHFLYNALGSIQEIILTDPKHAFDLLGDFTVHLKNCVRAMSSDELIPFKEELENIKAYVNIEMMRFQDKLHVEYKIDADDFSVVPLTIQPLVENAIRHGIYKRGKKGGTVYVQTWEDEQYWRIKVEDNGVGFDAYEYKEWPINLKGSGLKNIRFRLEKLLNAKVEVDSVPDSGTRVLIRIPKKQKTK